MPPRLALLLLAGIAAATPASARLRCAPGSFVVHTGPRVLPGATGSYDVLRVIADGRRRTPFPGARSRATLPAACCGE